MTTITRYAYVNTRSEAGRPEKVVLDSSDVTQAFPPINTVKTNMLQGSE